MQAGTVLKQLSLLALTMAVLRAVLGVTPAFAGAQGAWATHCTGEGTERSCRIATRQHVINSRGARIGATLMLHRDARCRSLHVTFDMPIAVDRPVTLSVDGGPSITFYTGDQLTRLARAVDQGTPPRGLPAELLGFFQDVESGRIGRGEAAGAELVARFAHIKESWRLGMACAPTERLLPALRTGQILRVNFWTQGHGPAQVYHWPQLTARSVAVPLDGLADELDRAAPGP